MKSAKAEPIDMSVKVGGRIVAPAFPVVSSTPPSEIELSFNKSLDTYLQGNVPLESVEGIQRRERALNRIGQLARDWIQHVCQQRGLPPEMVDHAGGQLFTSGSYRLGVHEPGADIDTILVAPNVCTRADFFGITSMDAESGVRDKDSLAERIRRHSDVTNFLPVENSVVPLLTFDWEGVNIDLLFATVNSASVPETLDIDDDRILDGVDVATEKSLNGPRVTNLIAALVSGTPQRYQTFLTVVRCVRKWCKARGLYSNKMGYWGGVNINIAVALCVQLYPLDCPASLLRKFFLVLKTWRWPNPIMLTKPHDAGFGLAVWTAQHSHRQVAPIITPAYPSMNSTLSTSRQTLQIMHEEFCRGHSIVDKLWKEHQQNLSAELDWSELFQPSDFFIAYPQYLSLCIVGPTQADAQAWAGFVEAKLRKLISDMLGRSLPLSKIQLWPKKIQACVTDKDSLLTKAQRENSLTYFAGFQVDKLRMRGSQLNIEQQLLNFREWELSKFHPLVNGMDILCKSFKVKELPLVCFEEMGMDKVQAMKRRRMLRDADPKRQERKRLKKLKELKEKMAEIQKRKQLQLEQRQKEQQQLQQQQQEQQREEEGDKGTTVKVEKKRKRDGGPEEDEEEDENLIKKEIIHETTELDNKLEGGDAPGGTNEEANLLENIFDTMQDEGDKKTREEAEADRRKLLAGEMLKEGEVVSSDEEDETGYTGDGARQSYMLNKRRRRADDDNQESTQSIITSKFALPLTPEQAQALKRAGIPMVGDDEPNIVILGDNVTHPERKPPAHRMERARITFKTDFDIVELDANGFLIDKGDEDFSPSKRWAGRRAGFEFKLGERGLGYYRTGKKVVVPSNTAY